MKIATLSNITTIDSVTLHEKTIVLDLNFDF